MTMKVPSLLVGILMFNAALAQDGERPPAALGHAYVAGGAFFAGDGTLFLQDITRITSGSTLFTGDLSGYSSYDYYGYPWDMGAGLFTGGLSIHPLRRVNAPGPELRLGFIYGGRSGRSGYFSRTDSSPYDTLTSSQTGDQYYVDSIWRSSYYVAQMYERFGLDAALVWHTQGRWSIHAGVGLMAGVLANVQTFIEYNEFSGVSSTSSGGHSPNASGHYGTGDLQYVTETLQRGTGWWTSLYTPLGLDFRFGRVGDFWTRVHAFMELRPQLVVQHTDDLGTNTTFGIQNLFGLRFRL
jgi:hypothetical protein